MIGSSDSSASDSGSSDSSTSSDTSSRNGHKPRARDKVISERKLASKKGMHQLILALKFCPLKLTIILLL